MASVAALLAKKGARAITISPEATVYSAIKTMDKERIGALVVVEAGMVVGLISERDYARKVILKGRASMQTRVKEIMTCNVHRISPERTLDECMATMTKHDVRHLPVMRDSQLVGLLSLGDLVKEVIDTRQLPNEQMAKYIASSDLH